MGIVNKLICTLTAVLFVVAGCFPPWTLGVNVEKIHSEKAAGWYPIYSPPEIWPLREKFYAQLYDDDAFYSVKIDEVRLLIEWACILAAGFAAWVIFLPRGRDTAGKVQESVAGAATGGQANLVGTPSKSVESASALATMPDTVEKELRERVLDFVSTEFRQAAQQVRDRAAKFIHMRLRLAAQHHFSERQTMDGFQDAAQLRTAAEKFRALTDRQ